MKSTYTLFLICFLNILNAQYSITQSAMPLPGDVDTQFYLDSNNLHLGTSGINQVWNYSSITSSMSPNTSTYVAISSVPNASLFPNATIALEYGAGGFYEMYNMNGKKEYLGTASSTLSNCAVWNNPLRYYNVPFAYGNSSSDSFNFFQSGDTYNGTISANANGTGVLIMPTYTLSNVLRIQYAFSYTITGTNPGNYVGTQVEYYAAANKFPILSVGHGTYSGTFGTSVNKNGSANGAYFTGMKEDKTPFIFSLFPNPVTNNELTINLTQNSDYPASICIRNIIGQTIATYEYTFSASNTNFKINTANFDKGIYLIEIKTKEGSLSKKIIIE
ncbi:MAG: T9SS type A sorting domain-containing protein [Bacteroidia bacterium]|nr:T9SS type A sorting domain-containing protein [Bacteroidia bacterium]